MVFKIEKTKNYTVMSNYHLRDKNLSLKAKGLLSFMLSLPDTWDYSLNGLCAVCKEQERAIKSTLKELKEYGYLVIEKVRGEKGYFEYNYLIYEQPIEIEKEKNNPEVQNPPVDGPLVEDDTQINTKETNTEEQIDKADKTKSTFFAEDHNSLTIDLINRGFLEKDDIQIFYYDSLFDNLLDKYDFKDIVTINHYIIPRVIERDFCDEEGEKIENKFGYFKSAMLNNIDKLKNNEIVWDEETGWFKEKEEYDDRFEFEDLENYLEHDY